MQNIILKSCTSEPELLIEEAARICHDSFEKMSPPESTKRIIEHLLRSGHESVLEHASATFLVTGVSRALTHQLVRHRIASYSQRSQRYVKEKEPNYVTPPSIVENTNKIISKQWDSISSIQELYDEFMSITWEFYSKLLEAGVKGEDARFVLPNACCSEIFITMNFRELRHFFKLRTSSHAQWEIKNMAKEMHRLIMEKAPLIFGDIVFEEE